MDKRVEQPRCIAGLAVGSSPTQPTKKNNHALRIHFKRRSILRWKHNES
jgi:hypothetical protein